MANVAKLKKRALDFEQKKQFDKALETYMQILGQLDEHVTEADMALYNRVGDLLLRRGDTAAAVDHYDKAVDLYTESGFFNNAIALCNKVLRNAPGRASVYYKLGRISAKKGFINDAKQNFLEYADRMQQSGDLEEAFRALKEFADLCPDQDDIRLMLADQLVRKDRKPEAIEQLQRLYEKFQTEGRATEARATLDRMRAIDPNVQPRKAMSAPTPRSSELVFLDVNYDGPSPNGSAAHPSVEAFEAPAHIAPPTRPAPAPAAEPEPSLDQDESMAEPMTLSFDSTLANVGAESLLDSVEPVADEPDATVDDSLDAVQDAEMIAQVDGFITGFDSGMLPDGDDVSAESGPSLLDLDEPPISRDMASELQSDESSAFGAMDDTHELSIIPSEVTAGDLPMLDLAADEDESIGGELDLILPDDPLPPGSGAGLADAFTEIDDLAPDAHVDGADIGDRGSALLTDPPAAWLELSDEESMPVPEPVRAPVPEPPRPVRATERLRLAIAAAPQNWQLHRQLAEALFEEGDRQGGLRELETAMLGLESANDLKGARAVAEEIIRVEPSSVRHHQKRVEYSVRANDLTRLVDAYVDLAEALFRIGELDKSRVVYGRVLELAPTDPRVRSALDAIGGRAALAADSGRRPSAEVPTIPPRPAPARQPDIRARPAATAPPRRATPTPRSIPAVAPMRADESFVNLAEWVRDEEEPKSTRMVVDVKEPAHEDQVDFAEMLAMFKQGVAANVDEADHESHYDLGVAYKEMGLLDEAISEFQKALRGAEYRVRSYEALGQCFVEKEQYQIAVTLLARALGDKQSSDDVLVGVLYLLGYASEMMKRWADAQRYYERVFAVDIQFRDVRDRLAAITHTGK